MKPRLFLLLFVLLVPSFAWASEEKDDPNAPIFGMWAASRDGDRLQLNLFRGTPNWSNYGFSIPLESVRGLSETVLTATPLTPVTFELPKEAGTVAFTGHFKDGNGSGHYRFTSSERFAQDMQALGFSNLTQKQLFRMAIHDLTTSSIRELRALGYGNVTADELIKLAVHRVTPELIRELRSVGYSGLTTDQLRKMGIHGAGPAFIRELQALGYRDLTPGQLVKMRIHDVTAPYIREMRSLGFKELTPEQLVKMRIHGIDSDYVRAMRKQ